MSTGVPSSRLEKADNLKSSIYSYERHGCESWNVTPSYEEQEEQRWHKKPKTAKITIKHNGHTRGEFVLIILLNKRGYFEVFSVQKAQYPRCKNLLPSRVT